MSQLVVEDRTRLVSVQDTNVVAVYEPVVTTLQLSVGVPGLSGPAGPDDVLVGKPVAAVGAGDDGKALVFNISTDSWELVDIATQAELDAISAGTIDLSGYATDAELAAEAAARASADAAHEADTTAVHGIADTSALVTNGDSRLTDARTPLAHTHPQSDVTGLTAALAAKQDASTAATDAELAAEATARAGADTAETNARVAADNAEATARANADVTLTAAAAAAQATANAALPTAGGTMTGKIVLDGDPTANLHPATKQWVAAQINALINGAPSALDTLNEIAVQLTSDEGAVTALTATVAGKLASANNLSDLGNAVTARTNLGLGSAATHPAGDFDAAGAAAAAAAASDPLGSAAAAQAASQPLDSDLTALAALTTTAFGRGLLTYANAAALLTGIGAVATTDARLSDTRTPTDGTVTNAKVAAGAAIAYSKLALTGSIVVADLAFDPATQAELDAKPAISYDVVGSRPAGADKDLFVQTDEALPPNASGTNMGLWQKQGGAYVRIAPRQKHGDNHAVAGIDPLFPSDIGEWMDIRRTGECETVPPSLIGPSVSLGTNGGVFGIQARARSAQTFTQIRCRCAAVGTAVTFLRMGVFDSTGAKLAETADLVASMVVNANLTGNLLAPLALTKGQIVYLAIAGIATTTLPSFNSTASTQIPASVSSLSAAPLTRTATGWAGGAFPANTTATGAAALYWIVLL